MINYSVELQYFNDDGWSKTVRRDVVASCPEVAAYIVSKGDVGFLVAFVSGPHHLTHRLVFPNEVFLKLSSEYFHKDIPLERSLELIYKRFIEK